MEEKIWVISACHTSGEGVWQQRVSGTEDEVKAYLVKLAEEDREIEEGLWDYGCESVDDVYREEYMGNRKYYTLNACSVYRDHHIEYTAVPEEALEVMSLSKVLEQDHDTEKDITDDVFLGKR
jgi:hypothetical protein